MTEKALEMDKKLFTLVKEAIYVINSNYPVKKQINVRTVKIYEVKEEVIKFHFFDKKKELHIKMICDGTEKLDDLIYFIVNYYVTDKSKIARRNA